MHGTACSLRPSRRADLFQVANFLEADPSELERLSPTKIQERFIYDGCTPPDIMTVKDFIRWKVSLPNGTIVRNTTVDSMCTFMEWFFGGFARLHW